MIGSAEHRSSTGGVEEGICEGLHVSASGRLHFEHFFILGGCRSLYQPFLLKPNGRGGDTAEERSMGNVAISVIKK